MEAANSWKSTLSSSGSAPVLQKFEEDKGQGAGVDRKVPVRRPLPPHPSRQQDRLSGQQQAEQDRLEVKEVRGQGRERERLKGIAQHVVTALLMACSYCNNITYQSTANRLVIR